MNENNEAKPFDIDLYMSRYLVPVLEGKRMIINLLLICTVIFFILSLLIKPEYTSQATVLVEEPRSYVASKVEQKIATERADISAVLAEAEKIKSSPFAQQVLKIIPEELKEDLEYSLDFSSQILEGIRSTIKSLLGDTGTSLFKKIFRRKVEPLNEYSKQISLLKEMDRRMTIETKAVRGMIWIKGRTFNKEMAPLLVKSYLDVWMALNIEKNKEGIRTEFNLINEQRKEAQQTFSKTEDKLIDFKRKYEIPAELSAITDIVLQLEMSKLQTALNTAKERFEFLDKIMLETQRKERGLQGNVQVISPPVAPVSPSSSVGRLFALVGALGGFSIGVLLTLVKDKIQGIIRHEMDITESLHLPVIGHVPRI